MLRPCGTPSVTWLIMIPSAKREATFSQIKLTRADHKIEQRVRCSLFVSLCVSADSTVTDASCALCLMPLVRGL